MFRFYSNNNNNIEHNSRDKLNKFCLRLSKLNRESYTKTAYKLYHNTFGHNFKAMPSHSPGRSLTHFVSKREPSKKPITNFSEKTSISVLNFATFSLSFILILQFAFPYLRSSSPLSPSSTSRCSSSSRIFSGPGTACETAARLGWRSMGSG